MISKSSPVVLVQACVLAATVFVAHAGWCAAESGAPAGANPRVFCYEPAALTLARERIARNDPSLRAALAELRREADHALTRRPLSVMDKTRIPPSGDKHDYYSQAPYWWPDPTKPDGKPYVRKDGQRNPEIGEGLDRENWGTTANAITTLGLAYFFTGVPAYAERAALLARVWFLDAATRMNPHLDYAQYVPGVNQGRGIGIIETHALTLACDSLTLIEPSGAWTPEDRRQFRKWLTAYASWLNDSANGREEASQANNHGSWYDVQVTYLALYLGHRDVAQTGLQQALTTRVSRQIEPDGRQPLELARTRSLNYSLFNLEALLTLAEMGRQVGVDYWRFQTPDGRGLAAAVRFLAPFADPKKEWIKRDLDKADRERILAVLAEARRLGGGTEFDATLEKFGASNSGRWQLLFPR